MWIRFRFKANLEDSRPVIFPPPGPWWETGLDEHHSTVVAYFPEMQSHKLKKYWPEAQDIQQEVHEEVTYTTRFQKPEWFNGGCNE